MPRVYLDKDYKVEHRPIRIIQRYALPFDDHLGAGALTVFDSFQGFPLPPLYSFALYFTHEAVNAGNVDASHLFDALIRETPYRHTGCPVRFDLYFLPGADAAKCVSHFYGEKQARGEMTAQIEQFENDPHRRNEPAEEADLSAPGKIKMPGFVPQYGNGPDIFVRYHYVLWICASENWKEDQKDKAVLQVEFDPIDHSEYEFDREEDVPSTLPPMSETWERITLVNPGDTTIGDTMFFLANQQEEAGVWHDALENGWKSW